MFIGRAVDKDLVPGTCISAIAGSSGILLSSEEKKLVNNFRRKWLHEGSYFDRSINNRTLHFINSNNIYGDIFNTTYLRY